MKQPSRPPFRNVKIVEAFRGEARAPLPLHPLERALVVVACVHLCFLPWAFGARSTWAQVVSALFGIVSMVLAAIPRRYSGDLAPQRSFTLHPWSRILKFPIFWLGLLFLGYITCQALNPAYVRTSAGPYWWLAPINHIEWLPAGVEAPFGRMNAWRIIVIAGGGWALACALYAGLTRRMSAQAILTALIINGGILALLGILQKVTAAKGIFWIVTDVPSYFTSTFYYKNHAGTYFNIIATVAVSLMTWHHLRSHRRMERSSPAPVYAFLAVHLAAVVFLSGSRTAMVLLIGYIAVYGGILLIWRLRNREKETTSIATTGLGIASMIIIITATGWLLNLDKSIEQIREVATEHGHRLHMEPRILARQATWDLFIEKPGMGWGAGSFQHVFPIAQRNYDAIYRPSWTREQVYYWDHAHNDYVQALSEFGIAGVTLLAAMIGWMLIKCLRLGVASNLPHFLLFSGLLLPFIHAWVDFPLYNCAIFTTLCALCIILIRWAEVEIQR